MPLNTRLAAPEIAYILEDSGAHILFVAEPGAGVLEQLKGRLASVREIVFLGEGRAPAGTRAYEDLLDAGAAPDAMRGGNELAGIFYTGGTTGKAKGVMLSHQNLVSNAANAVAGVGGTHTFVPKFDPADCLMTIQRERVTNGVFVPTMINVLVNFPRIGDYDTSTLTTIMFGASPMPEAVLRRALEVLPGCRFIHGYGMTEVAPIATLLDPRYTTLEGPYAGRLKSCGRAAMLCEVKIADERDHEVPPGTVGEVLVRGPNVMLGYWNQPEATAQALRGGWMHTGDGGYMDAEGFVYIVDRLKDMIITGGENVYSAEVESAIADLGDVAEAAVIGVPDDTWGESVHAIVVPRHGRTLTPKQVIAHYRTQIAGYKCPRSVQIRLEPLPLSGAGKILKAPLREPFWRGREKRVN